MGQYFKAVNKDTKEYVYSHDFQSGMKLMEHSYIGNAYVGAVELLLTPKGAWYKAPIVWAGDYADPIEGTVTPENESGDTWFSISKQFPWLPQEFDHFAKVNDIDLKEYRYIINHTKKEYVDKDTLPNFNVDADDPNDKGWTVNPLPILTADGNGRGGGDYHNDNPDIDLVGVWAGDSISVEKEKPEGYSEIEVGFTD